jgi:hypothetical protein
MKITLRFAFLLAAILTISAISASAQNMSATVKTVAVKFPVGKTQTTVRGKASHAMSYVYTFKIKKGQTIDIKAVSDEPELTFSLFPPNPKQELAFSVKKWTGKAPESGTHSITLVMNNENAKQVPYSLTISVK